MFYAVIFFSTLLLIFILVSSRWGRKPPKFPPGPRWYPIVGCALQIQLWRQRLGMFCKVIDLLAKKYVNPYGYYGLKIGKDKVVIAYTNDAINEMMTNEDIDGRPDGIFYRLRTFNSRLGVLLTDGEMWIEQRRFILRHLKNFGFARSGMMGIVNNEANCLLEDLKRKVRLEGGGVKAKLEMHDLTSVYVLNTLWCMLSGRRYEPGSPEITELLETFFELFKNIDMVGALFSHFPLLRFIAPDFSGYTGFVDSHRALYHFMSKEIELHRQSFRNYDEPRDLMDSYLRAQDEGNDPKGMFSDESLLAICLDMFLAGSETTNKSLGFCFMHLVLQPEIQEKAFEEIKEHVGLDRIPEWSDRLKLPYCEAITMEAVRFFMLHTFGIPHRAVCHTRLSGYEIPKDTMVIACFRGMLINPIDFPEPLTFDPTRYLIDGQLKLPEAFNPFGFGRHRCMGDLLGRQNLFMFTTTVLQNFKLVALPDQMPEEVPLEGATAAVKPYDVMLYPREGVKI
ncbi:uncharacterized protein Dwil_GK24287 [Drosophila willistoni]|uniref:Uncharacterized protein n=1 Tax=Drosophila willistoni TaxID=7260 RepID=B4MZZ0_DROWI|nr:probable cytochrome P450 303a1 [Drosophila willistoni]EDW77925.1 uncharacterized protein Dwil_GK24287 [Drosophila willistoni]